MNKRHYEHTLPNIRGSLSNTYRFSAFKRQKSWIASFLPQGGPLWGLGWLKENHPRFAAVFSFAKPCAKRQSKGRRPIKSGKHIPMGLFILKNLKT